MQIFQKHRKTAEKEPIVAGTPQIQGNMPMTLSGGCPCESCLLLRTQAGQMALGWMLGFYQRAAEAAKMPGAVVDRQFELALNGPSAVSLAGAQLGWGSESYLKMPCSIRGIIETDPELMSRPDIAVLREHYGDDPVLAALIDWIERRTR